MDFVLHEFAHCRVNQAVTGEGGQTAKLGRHQRQTKMSAARSGARVACMLRALILEHNIFGCEAGKALVYQFGGTHAGNTFLKGLTLTEAYTPAAR